MKYEAANKILPRELVEEIQKYTLLINEERS